MHMRIKTAKNFFVIFLSFLFFVPKCSDFGKTDRKLTRSCPADKDGGCAVFLSGSERIYLAAAFGRLSKPTVSPPFEVLFSDIIVIHSCIIVNSFFKNIFK